VIVSGGLCVEEVHPEHTRIMKKAPKAAIKKVNFIIDPLFLFII
jgi:hypothetical protein